MKIRSALAMVASGVLLVGCKGLKDALTAHTDVAASAANNELSATRLGGLLGNARIGIEPSKENAQIVADLWSDYQRLGLAAAHNDSLTGDLDESMKPIFDNMRVSMMIDTMRSKITTSTNPEASYNAGAGGILSARHILFKYPEAGGQPNSATPAQKDSVRKIAAAVLPQVTDANFVAMVKRHSGDAGSVEKGGAYTMFPREQMMPEFSAGVEAVKPGEINKSLIETPFGLHVIQRLPYSTVKAEYDQQFSQITARVVDSTISANLTDGGAVTVKPTAAAPIKEAIKNPAAHKKDKTVIATFKGGDMTVGQFLGWVDVMPGQMRQQVMQIVPTWPDTQVTAFAKNMAMRQLLLRQADSAKLDVPATEKANLKLQFSQLVQNTWMQLGLTPKELADSGKTEKDRERIAAARVDSLIGRILNGEANPVSVPLPLKAALDAKYDAEINTAGIDRAVEAAKKARTVADSARMGQSSQVPVPGMPGPTTPPSSPPPGTKRP